MIRFLSLILIYIFTLQTADLSGNEVLQVHIRDGSIVSFQASKKDFVFFEAESGRSKKRIVNWSEIKRLDLVESPVGERTQQIERLLQQLTSSDYETREQAEELLSDSRTFGPFESIIRDAAYARDMESDYRLQRVLSKLEQYNGSVGIQLDELTLKDGTRIVGDARKLTIAGHVLDQKIRIDRNKIIRVVNERASTPAEPPVTFKMQTFNQPIPEFYRDESETIVSFEFNRNGEPIPPGENANELFVDQGLRFNTENKGYVGTLRYDFKYSPVEIEPGIKCVCPFDLNSKPPRLHGTTIITFCLPGQADTPAGVHKFGLLVEEVGHSRDVVVEAYNAIGQMIGMVEASDQACVFAGFKSNELISSIRISRNDDLPDLEREIDSAYAFDCVTFDNLIEVDHLYDASSRNDAVTNAAKIDLKSGQLFSARNKKFRESEFSFDSNLFGKSVTVKRDKLRAIRFHRTLRLTSSENDYLMVQLKDGSTVKTEIESLLSPFDFIGSKLELDQVVGIWSGSNKARLAEQSDFEKSKPVIVYPSCRIIAESLKLDANKFKWDSQASEKIVQNVKLFSEDSEHFLEEEEEDPDFTPYVDQVDFKQSAEIPSLWLSQPLTIDTQSGHVLLTDGQYFVLGHRNGFRLDSINDTSIEVSFGDSRKKYPMTRVSSIKFSPSSNGD